MNDNQMRPKEPLLNGVITLYLPAADPYITGKWYCDMFHLDPNSSEHSPLREDHTGAVVIHTKTGLSLFFIQSNDKPTLSFHNSEGYNHAILLLQVKDIDEVYERMRARGVRMISDNGEPINDRGGCGREFAFFDPDGRKVEISTWGT